MLTISDVNLTEAGWAEDLGTRSRPILARKVPHTVPYTFVGVAAAMYGIQWSLKRRHAVAQAEGRLEVPATEPPQDGSGESQ